MQIHLLWHQLKHILHQVMSELAGYYGGVTSIVCYLLPWIVCIGLAIMLYRIIQVTILWSFDMYRLIVLRSLSCFWLLKGQEGQHSLEKWASVNHRPLSVWMWSLHYWWQDHANRQKQNKLFASMFMRHICKAWLIFNTLTRSMMPYWKTCVKELSSWYQNHHHHL